MLDIDFQKLKREWKTFAIAVAGILIESYDAFVVAGAFDLPALFPPQYRPFVGPFFLGLMLLLRKYKDHNVQSA